MIRVTIKNLSNVETHRAEFATQELADAWIASQVAKGDRCAWGIEGQYTVVQSNVTAEVQLRNAKAEIRSDREFGRNLVDDFAIENVILGIDGAGSDNVLNKLNKALEALSNGYLETAIRRVKAINHADFDGTFLTEARLLIYVNRIETYRGLPLSTEL